MKQTLTALAVLLLVGCTSPTAPEMPMEQSSSALGSVTSAHHFPAGDPHEWMGSYSGSWVHQLGSESVTLTVLNVREDLKPIQVTGNVTVSGVTFRIGGNLSFKRNSNRWSWQNVATTAGCRAGDMTGEFEMVDDFTITGFSELVIIPGCMGRTPPPAAPKEKGKAGKAAKENGGGKTTEPTLSGPCALNRVSL